MSTALAKVEQQLIFCADDPEWQRTWLTLQAETWRSLAVIPADRTFSSLEVVHGLAAVAWQQRGTPIVVADLRQVKLPMLDAVHAEIRRRTEDGELVMLALRSVEESPATVPIAKAADKSILCVGLGTTPLSHVRATVRKLGRQRFLGTIVIQPSYEK